MRSGAGVGFLCLVLVLISSCSTDPAKLIQAPPGKVDLDQLVGLVASEPEAVFEKLESWQFEGLLTGENVIARASTLAVAATVRLADRLSESAGRKDWREARRDLSSLSAISGMDGGLFGAAAAAATQSIPEGIVAKIALDQARDYRDKGQYMPALLALHNALDAGGRTLLGENELTGWIASMRKAGDEVNASRFASLMDDQSPGKARGSSIRDEIAGVVTVYVDKGLKIENGVGYPDRVLGTAFQVDPDGYYLTNYHVIDSEVDPEYEGYSRLSIRPSSRPEARIPAKVVGWNRALDLALIKSSEKAGHTFALESSEEIEKGSRVYAIGSPVGLENSVSSGIVSSQGRRILSMGEALQIDVPVNPGNSGGPLVTEEGNLAGVVFAGLANFQGLNFALPMSWIEIIAPRLFDGGEVGTASLGLAAVKNLDDSVSLSYVFPGTPCFKPGDRVTSLDGKAVKTLNDIQILLAAKPLGSLCMVMIERAGQRLSVLRRTQAFDVSGYKKASKLDSLENLLAGSAGMMIEHISGPRGNGGTYKVVKAWPGMAGDESGISEGDSLVLLRSTIDQKAGVLSFDVMLKSPSKGYLERTMRMTLSMKTDNFI